MTAPVSDGRGYLSDQPPVRRFRRRVFFYLLTLSLATSAVSGGTYYARQVKFIEKDRARRAHTLLTSLATQAELGAYAGDAALCDLPTRRTFGEEDVVLAGIYDPFGKEILRLSAPAIGHPPPPPLVALAKLTEDPDAPPMRFSNDVYDDMWAPIVTTARAAAVAASSEPGGAAARREVVGLARIGLSLTGAREQLSEVLRTGGYLTVGLLLLGALAALLIAGKISDPILALARGADEIRGGNLDVTIEVRSRDELGLLAESFNRMAAQLRETMSKLESLNKNLESEVSRRTDEIRRSAEFTGVLNAPIDREAPAGSGAHPELDRLLETALKSLAAGTGLEGVAVLLTSDESVDFELQVAAAHGAEPRAFGNMPSEAACASGQPIVESGRAIVPILFRGEPEGAIVLLDASPSPHAVEFAARAAGQLAIAISNVRAYNALQHLAKQLKERNAALEKQRDQLSEMNRLKSEFLANVSHELRTPLNAILGYTEIIIEGIYGPTTEQQREGLAGIEESGRNLLTLINQILDLSKVESGKTEVYVTDVAMHDVVHAVVSEAQALAKARPYKVTARCPQSIVIKTDGAKVKQIVTNLVSNAVKFTERGSVVIELVPDTPDTGGCLIRVRDTGIGIKKEEQGVIFEEFRQLDGSSTRKFAGTGLGLAIARRFAHLLSGSISVESTPGVGSTFTLQLPAETRTGARPPAPPPAARISAKMEAVRPTGGTPK
jgi:signal transduction histidine kinase/HAMP domain-containing protein